MKYLVIVSALLLGACGTMNAAIDGTQDMVNNTLGGVGNTVADITVAVGQDVKGVVDSGKQDKE
jgi:starvation-inducible outer membrane lipoprotein